MSYAATVPTHHLRFVRRAFKSGNQIGEPYEEYKFILQQRWDTTKLGEWKVTSIWKDVPVENEECIA